MTGLIKIAQKRLLTLSSSLISAKAGIFQVSRVLYPWNFPKCHRLKNIRSVRLASRR